MPRARPVASGSDVIRLDKPKKKGGCGCGSSCSCAKCKNKKPGRLSRPSSATNMDRNDALTPTEYLAACDLGIQGRPRAYIRARLDAAAQLEGDVREDMPDGKGQKCGKSGIAKGKKCKKGAGASTSFISPAAKTGAKVGAVLGAVAGAPTGAGMGTLTSGGMGAARKAAHIGGNAALYSGTNAISHGLVGAGIGGLVGLALRKRNKDKKRGDSMPSGRGGKKCGNSTIPANKQCRNGVGSAVAKGALAAGVAVGAYKGGEKLGAAVAKRGGVKAVTKKAALKTATAAGSVYGNAKRTVGAVRAAGPKKTAIALASSAGKATAQAQNALGKAAQSGQQTARAGSVMARRKGGQLLRKATSMIKR
mgnify:CR=1 FL=1